jgi:hypothetical protein
MSVENKMDEAVKQAAKPFEQEMAEKLYGDIMHCGHAEQVSIFCNLRQLILDNRKIQQETISKQIAEANQDLEKHVIGSNTIAAGL